MPVRKFSILLRFTHRIMQVQTSLYSINLDMKAFNILVIFLKIHN